jgi:hypothetical protein
MEDAVEALSGCLRDLRESLRAVRVTIAEDRPASDKDDHKALVDLTDAADDLIGLVSEAIQAAAGIANEVLGSPDLSVVRRELISVHECVLRIHQRLRDDVQEPDRVLQLRQLVRTWGGPWSSWLRIVMAGVTDSVVGLDRVDRALLSTWRALAVQASSACISVHAVGQQFRVDDAQLSLAGGSMPEETAS